MNTFKKISEYFENHSWLLLVLLIAAIIFIPKIYTIFVNKASNTRLAANLRCDGYPSGEVNLWENFTDSNNIYTISFPKTNDSVSFGETPTGQPEGMEGAQGASNSLALRAGYSDHRTYSVERSIWLEEPNLTQLAKYYGATKFCSKTFDIYNGKPMIDFIVYSSHFPDNYSRYRIIVNGRNSFALKMNSNSSYFKDYDSFVQSFRLQ